jgi:ABC-type Fe3+/spermidine/putrescine transport system ATPase subunit
VFNDGRIEQLASPVELYERPASGFVAGFVGTSNLFRDEAAQAIVGEAGTFVIRPEKISLAAAAPTETAGLCVAPGVVREVVYLGASTSTVVELDAGRTRTPTPRSTPLSSGVTSASFSTGDANTWCPWVPTRLCPTRRRQHEEDRQQAARRSGMCGGAGPGHRLRHLGRQ